MSEIDYLGQPYSHPDPAVMQHRYEQGRLLCAQFTRSGLIIFAPIVHWHNVAKHHDLPRDFDFWMKLDLAFLSKCRRLLVAKLPGWESSKGLTAERKFAEEMGIPIDFVDAPMEVSNDKVVA